jgi:phytoene dehydrogenase-like protein
MSRYMEQRSDGVDLRKPVLCYTSFEEHVAAWTACARGLVPDPMPLLPVIPTGVDPSQAPEGKDTVWMWTGIATAHPHESWETQEDAVAEREIARAAKYLGGLQDLIIDRQVMTPPKFEERFRTPDGNVYHVDPTASRFGPLRPAQGLAGYRTPVDGLFISGGGTHPSAGICGVPGKLAAKVALRTLRKGRGRRSASRTADSANATGIVKSTAKRARALTGNRG